MIQEVKEKYVYSVKEAAERLGVSYCHMGNMVRAGEVPCRRLGRRIIIPVKPFEEWLNSVPLPGKEAL